ncbi:MAG: hypothetical protein ACK5HP_03470 [Bacilli bacterium]
MINTDKQKRIDGQIIELFNNLFDKVNETTTLTDLEESYYSKMIEYLDIQVMGYKISDTLLSDLLKKYDEIVENVTFNEELKKATTFAEKNNSKNIFNNEDIKELSDLIYNSKSNLIEEEKIENENLNNNKKSFFGEIRDVIREYNLAVNDVELDEEAKLNKKNTKEQMVILGDKIKSNLNKIKVNIADMYIEGRISASIKKDKFIVCQKQVQNKIIETSNSFKELINEKKEQQKNKKIQKLVEKQTKLSSKLVLIKDADPKDVTGLNGIVRDINGANKKKYIQGTCTLLLVSTALTMCACASSINEKNNQEMQVLAQSADEKADEIIQAKLANQQLVEQDNLENEELTSQQLVFDSLTSQSIEMINYLMSKGIEITEDSKDEMAYKLTLYKFFANARQFSDEEYAMFMQEGSIKPTDIFGTNGIYFRVNELLFFQTISAKEGQQIDYSKLYSETNDINLLNSSSDLIAKFNTVETSKERKEIAKEYSLFIDEKLMSDTIYTNEALETLIFQIKAFQEITNAYGINTNFSEAIQARLNTNIISCVEGELTVENIMNTFNISEEKAEAILEASKNSNVDASSFESVFVTAINSYINEKKTDANVKAANMEFDAILSIENVIEQVSEKIEITNYLEIENPQTYLQNIKESKISSKYKSSSDASSVTATNNAGETVIISQEQLDKYNIDSSSPTAQAELEAAVKVTEDSKTVVTDANNNVVNKTAEQLQKEFEEQSRKEAEAAAAEAAKNAQSKTEFIEESNGQTIITETPEKIYDYTNSSNNGSITNSDGTSTEFVPVDGGTVITEEITTIDYQSSISELKSMKELLLSVNKIADNNEILSGYTFTLVG